MKKLLLASNGKFLIEEGYPLLKIPKEKLRIGYVITACKGVDSQEYLEKHRAMMRQQGLAFEELDIEGKTREELVSFVRDKNVIHIEGGNTFYLLKAVKAAKFDKIIKEALDRGAVYAGTSAGAYIACPDISVAAQMSSKDNFGLKDFAALDLVPFLVVAHYTDEEAEEVKRFAKKSPYPVRILRDGQGILVENEKYTFVGKGKEVKL
jgi:dipeptidase E